MKKKMTEMDVTETLEVSRSMLKLDPRDIEYGCVDWIHLVRMGFLGGQRRMTAMNLLVPQLCE
jgi:hypothetical protein